MRIPRFWAVTEGSDTGPRGERLYRRVWGWSMSSAADALAVAQEELRTALATLRTGTRVGGYYPRKPLREPIVDETLVDGEQVLVITRNRYGAEVLNTDRVLIADVDLPERFGLLRRLFRRTTDEAERLSRFADWAAANPGLGVIVYRTASGFRVFVTGVTEPTSPEGERILRELDADPIYRELCKANGTFRARLTPKPWRLPGMKAPRGHWPFEEAWAALRFERWLADYQAASRGYAVCKRLAAHGPAAHGWEARILQVHDDRTGVATTLPLS